METIEKLQKKQAVTSELRSIVRTMKTLAAASIHQYDQAVEAINAYKYNIEQGLYIATKNKPSLDKESSDQEGEHLFIVFGSDHGLCGRFNESVINFSLERINRVSDGLYITIGARMTSAFEHHNIPVEADFVLPSSTAGITRKVQEVLMKIDDLQHSRNIEKVSLIYNQTVKGHNYQTSEHRLLPIDYHSFQTLHSKQAFNRWPSRTIPTHTLATPELLKHLTHQFLFTLLFRACAESQASEHTSRLSSMQSASRNLDDHLTDIKMAVHRARQNKITTELIDVMSAYEVITHSTNDN